MRKWFLPLLLLCCATGIKARDTYKLGKWGIEAGNYSGITALGENRYALVDDKKAGFEVWKIRQDSVNGKILDITVQSTARDTGKDRDEEDIAFLPATGTVFITGEADQRIIEVQMDGTTTGRELGIPTAFSLNGIQPNRGFEALCHDETNHCFWTTTESALKTDSTGHLRLLCFGEDMHLMKEVDYLMDGRQSTDDGRDFYHGVSAITALSDGRLLVLEREVRIAPRYTGSQCWCRLFIFDPSDKGKQLLQEWSTRFTPFNTRLANYEGMCLGCRLADGRQTILLISDAQGGYGKAFWHLKDRLKVIIL